MSGTRTLHCTNSDCPAKQLKKFARFVSKEGVNIDGLSEQTLQKFINLGWVREYSDLFHISQHAIVLRDMEGFGAKSVTNLLAATEKARQVGRGTPTPLCPQYSVGRPWWLQSRLLTASSSGRKADPDVQRNTHRTTPSLLLSRV